MPRPLTTLRWDDLNGRIVSCELCPRLREHCRETARVKRAAYAGETYWGRPVPNWAPADPRTVRLLIVGLAPGAHGANRTGRMFTGDRSGDFLFRAMHEAGLATQPTSDRPGDGLELIDCAITATAHCAPPGNKPLPDEVLACRPYLDETASLLPNLAGAVALGKIAWDACVGLFERTGFDPGRGAQGAFAHGAVRWSDNLKEGGSAGAPGLTSKRFLIGSYHPSQQNTFTGKLTPAMLRAVFETARNLAACDRPAPSTPRRDRGMSRGKV